jgi:hypothetical protein
MFRRIIKQVVLVGTISIPCSLIPLSAQNVISNGDFETFSLLPDDYGQVNRAAGWNNVNGNYSGSPFGSPDYYNRKGWVGPMFGPIYPVSGDAQMGFTTYRNTLSDYREYISCRLDSILLNAFTPGAFYMWQDNSTMPDHPVSQTGLYWVLVTLNACNASDTVEIGYDIAPVISLGNDTTLCNGSTLLLDPGVTGALYEWQDNSTDSVYLV